MVQKGPSCAVQIRLWIVEAVFGITYAGLEREVGVGGTTSTSHSTNSNHEKAACFPVCSRCCFDGHHPCSRGLFQLHHVLLWQWFLSHLQHLLLLIDAHTVEAKPDALQSMLKR